MTTTIPTEITVPVPLRVLIGLHGCAQALEDLSQAEQTAMADADSLLKLDASDHDIRVRHTIATQTSCRNDPFNTIAACVCCGRLRAVLRAGNLLVFYRTLMQDIESALVVDTEPF